MVGRSPLELVDLFEGLRENLEKIECHYLKHIVRDA